MGTHRIASNMLMTVLVAYCAVAQPLSLFRQGVKKWGAPESGLQMSLYTAHGSRDASTPYRFRVEIRNVGRMDLILNLGTMLGNGQHQYTNVRVLLTTPRGKTMDCGSPGPTGVLGTVGPMIVPLPVGSTFSLSVDLQKWTRNWKWCYTPRFPAPFSLTAGRYFLRAFYASNLESGRSLPPITGSPPSTTAWAWGGTVWFPVWEGKLGSNRIHFVVPARH